jgi:hypothetical protein
MALFYKELTGVHNLVGAPDSASYFFSLPQGTQPYNTNGGASRPIEEVYLNCDTTIGAIKIYLPSTTLFQGFWNTKIYTSWLSGANPVEIRAFTGDETTLPDTLNGISIYSLSDRFEAVHNHIVAPYIWMNLVCPPPM